MGYKESQEEQDKIYKKQTLDRVENNKKKAEEALKNNDYSKAKELLNEAIGWIEGLISEAYEENGDLSQELDKLYKLYEYSKEKEIDYGPDYDEER